MLDGEQLLASMTRPSAASVTPEWTAWWPLMRKRLLKFLRSRGISAHAAEDAVQDVAERLLTRPVPHTDIEDLMRWCMTVARNAAIDQHRRLRRSVPLDRCDDDAAGGSELVDLVEARMRLDRVLRALGNMSDDDVRCVMAGLDDDIASEVASPALRARRHRLRRRLSELVGGFGLAGLVVRFLRPRTGRATLGLSSAAIASVALVSVVAVGPHFGADPGHVRLHLAPATVQAEPVGSGTTVVRRGASTVASAHRAAAAPAVWVRHPKRYHLHWQSPDKRGTLYVHGHDRQPADKGLICLRGLRYVPDTCLGPKVTDPLN
jgi:DNA-directed RNA polymerase specialized sigma24 family protein